MVHNVLYGKNTVFICLALSFLFGIAFRSFVPIHSFAPALLILLFGSLSVIFFIQKKRTSAIFFLGIVLFCVGVVRYNVTLHPPEQILFSLINQQVTFEGVVVSPPNVGVNSQRFVVETEVLLFPNTKQSFPPYQYMIDHYPLLKTGGRNIVSISKTKVLVSAEPFQSIHIGDRVLFTGKLQEPVSFTTDTGKEFDYKTYLAKDNIFYSLSFVRIEEVISPESFHLRRQISSIKESFIRSLNMVLQTPDSALASGILLGVKQSLGNYLENAFIKTGLVHVVVLSGYNIGIIILFILWTGNTLFRVGKKTLIPITIGIIGLFMIMVGLGASIVRAGVMTGLALCARFFGYEADVSRLFVLTALVIVCISPRVLMFDISFQLSFLATIGILYATPLFEKWLSFIPVRFGIRSIVSATLGTQMLVFPFLLWRIGTLSIIAPITNSVVLPFIPLAMASSFVSGLAGLMFIPLGRVLGVITHFILAPLISFVEWSARLSFSAISIQTFPWWGALVLYVCITILLIRYNNKYGNAK